MPLTNRDFAQISPIQQIYSADRLMRLFMKRVNNTIGTINLLIDQYNNSSDSTTKVNTLYEIYQTKKTLELSLPLFLIADFPEYADKIIHQLFNSLKTQFASLGIHSMEEEFIKKKIAGTPIASHNKASPSEIIANMAPKKLNKLVLICSGGENFDLPSLQKLYDPNEPGFDEFQEFISTHSISFLGGGNAKNFKITNNATSHSSVLKVDYRLGRSREAEMVLRQSALADVLTSISAERQVYATGTRGAPIVRSVVVTDFCADYDLENEARRECSTQDRLKDAFYIYAQMATIADDMVKVGCGFPDMKNSNWLLSDNKLQLADTKSLVLLDNKKNMVFNNEINIWDKNPLGTEHITPPEFFVEIANCSADKMHAYMLGINLAEYLIGTDEKYLDRENHFNHPIFKSTTGESLKELITNLTQENPNDRMSVSEARLQLEKIAFSNAKEECLDYMQEFKQYHTTSASHWFMLDQYRQVSEATDYAGLDNIKTNFESGIKKAHEFGQTKRLCEDYLTDLKRYPDPTISAFIIKTQNDLYNVNDPNDPKEVAGLARIVIETEQSKTTFKDIFHFFDTKNDCLQILKAIKEHSFSNNDEHINKLIHEQETAIQGTTNQNDLDTLKEQLRQTQLEMQTDPVIMAVRGSIAQLQSKKSFYSIGVQDKIEKIQQAMAQVPLKDRGQIDLGATDATRQVLKEMASLRSLFKKESPIQDGKIVESKAASTYHNFKQKMHEIKLNTASNMTEETLTMKNPAP